MQAELEPQAQNPMVFSLWKLETAKCQFMRPLFKVVGFKEGTFLVNRPDSGKLTLFDEKLEQIEEFKFGAKPQSICVMYQPDGEPETIMVGCNTGSIIKTHLHTKKQQVFEAKDEAEKYVNDLLVVDNCLVNCYNNGTIRVWERNLMVEKVTMKQVHASYTYKLRAKGSRLFSCGHDKKVVMTDLAVCEPVRCFLHPQSVWGLHALNANQFASVGLFGQGMIWDLRASRVAQSWQLPKMESSFVTEYKLNMLVMGDADEIKTYDRRSGKVQTKGRVLLSAEAIYKPSEDRLVVAGRGGDVIVYRTDIDVTVPPARMNAMAMFAQNPMFRMGMQINSDDQEEDEEELHSDQSMGEEEMREDGEDFNNEEGNAEDWEDQDD